MVDPTTEVMTFAKHQRGLLDVTKNYVHNLGGVITHGLEYGYPECCIAYFLTMWDKRQRNPYGNQPIQVTSGTGFRACDDCNSRLFYGEVKIGELLCGRTCKDPFPECDMNM